MIRIMILAAAAVLWLSACTTSPAEGTEQTARADAVQTAASETPQTASATADDDEMICRNTRVTGSRKMHRVCHTQRQWDAMREGSREAMRDLESIPRGYTDQDP